MFLLLPKLNSLDHKEKLEIFGDSEKIIECPEKIDNLSFDGLNYFQIVDDSNEAGLFENVPDSNFPIILAKSHLYYSVWFEFEYVFHVVNDLECIFCRYDKTVIDEVGWLSLAIQFLFDDLWQ